MSEDEGPKIPTEMFTYQDILARRAESLSGVPTPGAAFDVLYVHARQSWRREKTAMMIAQHIIANPTAELKIASCSAQGAAALMKRVEKLLGVIPSTVITR